MSYRSSLGRSLPSKIDYAGIKRDAWRESGILVVDVETADGLSWVDRQHLRNIGDHLYGPRHAKSESEGEFARDVDE